MSEPIIEEESGTDSDLLPDSPPPEREDQDDGEDNVSPDLDEPEPYDEVDTT